MLTKLEIVKVVKAGTTQNDSSTKTDNWWKQPFVTIEPETDAVELTVSRSKALIVGEINGNTINQLRFAGFSVVRTESDNKIYVKELYIPLSRLNTWNGIKEILENCGYKVTVISLNSYYLRPPT